MTLSWKKSSVPFSLTFCTHSSVNDDRKFNFHFQNFYKFKLNLTKRSKQRKIFPTNNVKKWKMAIVCWWRPQCLLYLWYQQFFYHILVHIRHALFQMLGYLIYIPSMLINSKIHFPVLLPERPELWAKNFHLTQKVPQREMVHAQGILVKSLSFAKVFFWLFY